MIKYFSNSKKTITILNLLIVAFLFSSCEKVIDIDLNAKAPQVVIEGNISDQPGPYTVKLTQTVNYDETNTFPTISGAIVSISDNVGNPETLTETSLGIYSTSSLQGIIGRIYILKVIANGKEYNATSTIKSPVNIDTLKVIKQNLPMSNKKIVYVEFTDTPGIANYYRFIKIINNKIQPAIYVEDDLTQDGKAMSIGLIDKEKGDADIKSGDTVTIILQSLDESTYNYFKSLQQLNSGGLIHQSSSPANPLSNINNDALGYFNACSITSKTIILP